MNYVEIAMEHTKKVNILVNKLDNIKKMRGLITDTAKFGVIDDTRASHYLDDVLDEQDIDYIRQTVITRLDFKFNKIETEFNNLLGIKSNDEIVEKVKEEKKLDLHSSIAKSIDVDKFTKMYQDGYSKYEIANEFDISANTVYVYASKLGIKRENVKKKKDENKHVELTKDIVRSKYTLTDRSIEDVANELGVTKSELHEFITKNGLKRASKKEQEMFRDTQIEKKRNTPS